MDKELHRQAEGLLEMISVELKSEILTPQERHELEIQKSKLSGMLLSTWFPVPWSKRIIMIVIVGFGLWQMVEQNFQPLIYWVALPFFSPRIVGEGAFFIGKISGKFRNGVGRN